MKQFDVIVVGGGGAGVMAASAAAAAGARVALLSKEPIGYGNTRMAVGLTACAGVDGDTHEEFLADILASGNGLCLPHLVNVLVNQSRDALSYAEQLGHTFTRNANDELGGDTVSRAGGHTQARTLQSSGAGIGLGQSLRAAMEKYQFTCFEDTLVLELIKKGEAVIGMRALELTTGEEFTMRCGAVILATGGAGWLFYPQTSNNRGTCGDGYALAFMAGAQLMDMEQIQTIPFGITHPHAYRGLICGEPVVAGPHGRILDDGGNEVLGAGIHRLGRAAVVSAMADVILAGHVSEHGGLSLDLQPNLKTEEGKAFRHRIRATGITDTVLPAYGRKAYDWEEPWDVSPTVHFFMGGVHADENGATNVPGLYVAGEVMGGVHGGNRLGSVALTEILVFGLRAGQAAATFAEGVRHDSSPQPKKRTSSLIGRQGNQRAARLCKKLQHLMWKYAGLVRDREGLLLAAGELEEISKAGEDLCICNEAVYNLELRDAYELGFMLATAKLILITARLREESRGAHIRADYPEHGGVEWQKNIYLWRGEGGETIHAIKGWEK